MPPDDLAHVRANAADWDRRDEDQRALAARAWTADPSWGIFGVPESEVGFFPQRLEGTRAVELGCGTGYVSAWLARHGAHPVGVDPSANQLKIAASMQERTGIRFPLVRAAGEKVPLRSGEFDLAVSEYGAAIWADPYLWIPEAARLLRPGGELVFLRNSTLMILCAPDEEDVPATNELLRPQFGMHRVCWPGDPTTEFHLGHGDWIRLFRRSGFTVEDLIEIRPHEDASSDYGFVTVEWARQWPCEEVWRLRRS